MNQQYPMFFNDDRVPARIMAPMKIPEIYRGNGKWVPYPGIVRMMAEANPITKPELDQLVKQWDAAVAKRK